MRTVHPAVHATVASGPASHEEAAESGQGATLATGCIEVSWWPKTFYSEHLVTLHELYPSTDSSSKGMVEMDSFKEKAVTEDEASWTTSEGTDHGYHGGLGQIHKYPGDPKKLKDRYKTRLWKEYFEREDALSISQIAL
jgi:hypothetical protein